MTAIRSICVFCGSASGRDPTFAESARILGKAMAESRIGLVYGGGNSGLMGMIARTVLGHGGHVTGIIPEFLRSRELMLEGAHSMTIVPDMHTRKRLMFEHADAFVTLPGGIGTLEELLEQMTWTQLDQHQKPVVIANIAGFWDPLLALIAHVRAEGFIRTGIETKYLVANRAEDILPLLSRSVVQVPLSA